MAPLGLSAPVKLEKHHDVSRFDSGVEELDSWLRDYGWANHRSGKARVFVAARGDRVVGYCALSTAVVESAQMPEDLTKGGVPMQVPCILLGRLAVDRSEANRGLGRGLVVDALRRTMRVSEATGVRALLIHARDSAARDFSLHLAEFRPSPTQPLHLFLSLKEARGLLRH